jgi:hypothetical protein
MEHEESLSTRDIAGGRADETGREAETDPAAQEPRPGGEAGAERMTDGETMVTERGTTDTEVAQTPAEPVGHDPSAAAAGTADTADTARGDSGDTDVQSLLPDGEETVFHGRWQDIQGRFVDDPRRAVEDADALVAAVMQRLADGFAEERERLEAMWGRGEDVGTEDLRVALQRYRSFFQRLLSA